MNSPAPNKILIPTGGYFNKANLLRALHLFSGIGDPKIVLLHIMALPQTVTIEEGSLRPLREEAERAFGSIVQWLREQGFSVDFRVAGARSVVDGIVEEAEGGDYRLILIQKTKKSGMAKVGNIVKRSTSERLLNMTSVPLLIIPP